MKASNIDKKSRRTPNNGGDDTGVLDGDRDYALLAMMYQVSHAIVRVREKELAKVGISPQQGRILYLIDAAGGSINPTQIAKALFRRPQTVSEIVNRMAEEGLVEKKRHKGSKSTIDVSMTDEGRKAYLQYVRCTGYHKAFSALSEEQWQSLTSAMNVLRSQLSRQLRTKLPPSVPGLA